MELELPIADLKKKITETLEENKKLNEQYWKLYVKKTTEYAKYLTSLPTYPGRKLKHAPYLQFEETRQLKEALEGLSIHIGKTIKIDDGEYRNLLEGVERLRAGARRHIEEISSLNYVSSG